MDILFSDLLPSTLELACISYLGLLCYFHRYLQFLPLIVLYIQHNLFMEGKLSFLKRKTLHLSSSGQPAMVGWEFRPDARGVSSSLVTVAS